MKLPKEDTIEIAKLDDGGFVIKTYSWEDTTKEGKKTYSTNTYAIKDEDDTKETLKKLLEAIASECGYDYDKWGSENLNITFDKKGTKADEN
jgi:hypothetical protein